MAERIGSRATEGNGVAANTGTRTLLALAGPNGQPLGLVRSEKGCPALWEGKNFPRGGGILTSSRTLPNPWWIWQTTSRVNPWEHTGWHD